jgi:hypothetical protein
MVTLSTSGSHHTLNRAAILSVYVRTHSHINPPLYNLHAVLREITKVLSATGKLPFPLWLKFIYGDDGAPVSTRDKNRTGPGRKGSIYK